MHTQWETYSCCLCLFTWSVDGCFSVLVCTCDYYIIRVSRCVFVIIELLIYNACLCLIKASSTREANARRASSVIISQSSDDVRNEIAMGMDLAVKFVARSMPVIFCTFQNYLCSDSTLCPMGICLSCGNL